MPRRWWRFPLAGALAMTVAALATTIGGRPTALAAPLAVSKKHSHGGMVPYPNPAVCKGRYAYVTVGDNSFTADTQVTRADLYHVTGGVVDATPFGSWTPDTVPAFHPRHHKITVRLKTTLTAFAPSKSLPSGILPTPQAPASASAGTGTILVLTTTTTDGGGNTTTTTDTNPPLYVEPVDSDPCP